MKANNTEVGGFEVIDVCNNKAEELVKRYNNLQNRKAQLLVELRENERGILCLRAEEVNNVCEYVRTYSRMGVLGDNDIDCYLNHCQNMLSGNIDGTFLKFEKK